MNNFWMWFSTGLQHITDFNGYDHILFVTLLAIGYSFKNWKELLVLITAFTIGHSASLALSVLGSIEVNIPLIEFLIALTILITAVYQLFNQNNRGSKKNIYVYTAILFFGFIHGMGFSFLLKEMLEGSNALALPLLYFNMGLEVGQIAIVMAVLALNFLIQHLKFIAFNWYKLLVITSVGLAALLMCWDRLF